MSKQVTTLKNTTPEFNRSVARDLVDSLRDSSKQPEAKKTSESSISVDHLVSKSYSPTINELLTNLKSLSLQPTAFNCELDQQIRIKSGSSIKCVDWESKEAQRVMLHNLNSKKIDFSKIIAPANIEKNCWFNVFFMCFFISDKGRKFFRNFRHGMITGKAPGPRDITVVNRHMRWPMFLLNYYINSSIMGVDYPESFAEKMNTNILIREIGNILEMNFPGQAPMPGQPGNPLNYYSLLTSYMTNATSISVVKFYGKTLADAKLQKYLKKQLNNVGKLPHILCAFVNKGKNSKEPMKTTLNVSIDGKSYKYTLDSAVINDVSNKHYSALVTGNKREYASDGTAYSRLTPFSWKSKINSSEEFNFEGSEKRYNFSTSEIVLIYYRS